MKSMNLPLGASDILDRRSKNVGANVGFAELESWRRRLGYFSVLAGAAVIAGSQAPQAIAKESRPAIPPRIAQRGAELVKKLNETCSKPELLRRQSEYRLPSQKGEFNMLSLFVGADECPGAAIPPGTYTVAAPFTDSGTTVGANNTVATIPLACNGFYTQAAGADVIYSFQISARGANPQITSTTTSPLYDQSIYILNGATGVMCPAGTGNTAANCLQGADGTFGGSPETIDSGQMNTLPLNTPLYLFIDSFYSSGGGLRARTPLRCRTSPSRAPGLSARLLWI
ncbi:MAG: hypothetical protein IPM25_12015 [Chloracidobacterium sp.]|nr:hypothetical protein [Chloracidobacterium sp.]